MKSPKQILENFNKYYDDVEGILHTQVANFRTKSIVVFIDEEKFKSRMPREFEDIPIVIYNVKKMLKHSKTILDGVKKIQINKSDEKMIERFQRTYEICEDMVKNT
jgi:hypothetical protein